MIYEKQKKLYIPVWLLQQWDVTCHRIKHAKYMSGFKYKQCSEDEGIKFIRCSSSSGYYRQKEAK